MQVHSEWLMGQLAPQALLNPSTALVVWGMFFWMASNWIQLEGLILGAPRFLLLGL